MRSSRRPDGAQASTLKVVVVGESTVGKTSLINVANTGEFQPNESPTVGACFVTNNYVFPTEGRSVRLNIWDTAGQERYRSLAPMYFREMNAGCIVYAIDDEHSFDAVQNWMEGFDDATRSSSRFYLIGNKRDLDESRQVTFAQGEQLAARLGLTFAEVSAKTDVAGVTEMFEGIAKDWLQTRPPVPARDSLTPEVRDPAKEPECC
jgi:small GTP-binding protein